MTKVTDEMLMALADGELDETTASDLWRLMDSDASLRRRLQEAEATRMMAKEAFSDVLAEPVPEALLAVGMRARARPRWMAWAGSRRLPVGAAAVASVAGFVIGTLLVGDLLEAPSGLPPADQIATLVDSVPSGEARPWPAGTAASGTFEALASYPVPGGICRTFSVSNPVPNANDWQGVACRSGEGWNVELLVVRPRGGGESYATASDVATQSIDGFLDAHGADQPLDSIAEERVHAAGWHLPEGSVTE